MRRRHFLKLLGGMALAPLAARAAAPLPVIGFVSAAASGSGYAGPVAAFRKGLADAGFVEGRDVAIEYRWAAGALDRLPALVADLVARNVKVIVATSTPAALAAKAATTSIPIVFETAADPVSVGLIAQLNRPGGNITGVTQLSVGIVAKDLEVLHEMIPAAHVMALLVNPANAELSGPETQEAFTAAKTLGLELHVLNASAESEFDAVFAGAKQLQAGGLVIGADALFTDRSAKLAALAAQHGMPAIYKGRDFAAAGGLASYGLDITKTFAIAGNYAGRILKGDKPGDLPIQQPTDIQMFLNLKTAKGLGIAVPLPLLGRADEVFE